MRWAHQRRRFGWIRYQRTGSGAQRRIAFAGSPEHADFRAQFAISKALHTRILSVI
jgi:hypothetical protein